MYEAGLRAAQPERQGVDPVVEFTVGPLPPVEDDRRPPGMRPGRLEQQAADVSGPGQRPLLRSRPG